MTETILVVDDEESTRFTFKTFLEEAGYCVETAGGYDQAVNILSRKKVDVVISDIVMIGHTGIDLLRFLHEKQLGCPVIMITGQPSLETAAEAVRLGAYDYVSKPFNRDILIRVTERAVKHKRLFDEGETYRRNLEAVFQSVQDGILTVTPDQAVSEANDAAQTILGICPTGKQIHDMFTGELALCCELLRNTLQTRQPVKGFRTEWTDSASRRKTAVLNCLPLTLSNGTFIGAMLVIRDVSRIEDLERMLGDRASFRSLIGKSRPMQDIYTLIETLSNTETTVLIRGESGTGKELVADAIHFSGARALKPFIKVNCSALSEHLLESELFGHVAGAFTGATRDKPGRFELAHQGTIFLDEIGEITPSLQVKLLRFLQEKEFERVGSTKTIKVDVRVIAATNADLEEKISTGTFREDLYFRLNVMEMHLPPLRSRTEDIALLADHFFACHNQKKNPPLEGISETVMKIFMDYPWQGNVRELSHVIERAFLLCAGGMITPEHLPGKLLERCKEKESASAENASSDLLAALKEAKWNHSKAAKRLGISRQTLYRKLKEIGDPSS